MGKGKRRDEERNTGEKEEAKGKNNPVNRSINA